jgi:hypothetical protein
MSGELELELAEVAEDHPRVSGPAVVLGVLIGLALGVVALIGLLVVSPASFVSLVPEWFTGEGHSNVVVGIALFLVAAGLVALVLKRGHGVTATKIVLGFAVLILAIRGLGYLARHSIEDDSSPARNPRPDNTCVAYSDGGRQTCPGG